MLDRGRADVLTIGFLVALLIWPSWRRLWAFATLIALFSVFSVLAFATLAQTASDDSGIRAALFNYLVLYQGVLRKSVNLAAFVTIGALIVWLRLGAKTPKFSAPNGPGLPNALIGPFRLWVVCFVVVVFVGAWRTVSEAPTLPVLAIQSDPSRCAGAKFPEPYYEKKLSELEQVSPSPGNSVIDVYNGLQSDIVRRNEIVKQLDTEAEAACQARMEREFDPEIAKSEYSSALSLYWQDRAAAIAPYLLAPLLIPATLWLLWLVIRWVIRGFARGSN